ncbi:PRC-barrel domain-containing protein [Tranquillimonas rosea]|uniref:PRC-barrel domain-containing protein n=1 Tax=Tranquillimonas rosea TaxID=641238 RepID=UPI003BA982E3
MTDYRFLSAAALGLGIATAPMAVADQHESGNGDQAQQSDQQTAAASADAQGGPLDPSSLIRTRDITDGPIYTTNEADDEFDWDTDTVLEEVGTEWNQIGEIEDIVLDRSGQMVGIVAEVGGFIDITDKHVLLRVEDVKLVSAEDGSYAYVTHRNEEDLEDMENVDEGFWN